MAPGKASKTSCVTNTNYEFVEHPASIVIAWVTIKNPVSFSMTVPVIVNTGDHQAVPRLLQMFPKGFRHVGSNGSRPRN